MKVFALICFIGVASAARLDNTYLPPNSARTAGGNGDFLATPSGNQGYQNSQDDGKYTIASIQQQETPENGNFQAIPSGQYGAPTGHALGQQAVQQSPKQFSQSQANFGSQSYSSPNHAAPQRPQQPSPVYGPANGASSRSNSADAHANTLRFDNDNDGTGNYKFEYETENKISQQEQGELKAGAEGEVTVVRGSYSYVGDDGKTYTVNYIADENGFQPTGDHIDQAISMAAAEAARSAQSEGQQQGYNYNAQQGYSGQKGQAQPAGNGGYQY